jgi:hypothetical protein
LRHNSIGLWDLRSLLLHPATGIAMQQAVLAELVGRARRCPGAWTIGLVGVLLPGLREQLTGVAGGRSRGTVTSGGMALVNVLERLDDPGLSNEAAAESLLRTVLRPAGPARAGCGRHLVAVPRGPK